ncbi:MAG: winged helix-turn-helix domain-containing protein [Nanoarchaeota archaeon]
MNDADTRDESIVKCLVKNPRISDNGISRATGIPLKTVNRRRKALEADGRLRYYVEYVPEQEGRPWARMLFVIRFRKGITRALLLERSGGLVDAYRENARKHIECSFLAERDGQLHLVSIVASPREEDIAEIMNADVFPYLEQCFGPYSVEGAEGFSVRDTLRLFHTYCPGLNMENGVLSSSWSLENVFVGR